MFVLAIAAGACTSQAPSPSTAAASPAPASPTPAASGKRPVVFDTDMGMDDLLALYVILRDPTLDVRAIAIDGTGLIHCGAGIRNMRRILGAFDRLDIPFGCGREEPGPNGRSFPNEWRATSDAMYGVVVPPVVASEFPPDAVTILHDALAASADPVTILALGPWTNLQDLFVANPDTIAKVAGIHAMAGTIDAPGNVELGGTTAAKKVEWNVGADPDAFAAVMALDVPVSLVPLDATNDVPTPADIVETLDADHAAAGADLAFETYVRSPFLHEAGNYWWDSAAAVALTNPELFTWEDATTSVTLDGPATGRINRDPAGRPTRIAVGADTARVTEAVLAGLRRGAPRPEPFATIGAMRVVFDGATCRLEGEPPTKAGLVRIDFANRSSLPAGLLAAGARPPKTWADALNLIETIELDDPALVIPDWIVQVDGPGPFAEPGKDALALVTLPPGSLGVACATGQWPDLAFVDGGSFTLAE